MWCTGRSSWCFLSSNRCTNFLLKSDTLHIQPAFPQAGGRGYGCFLVVVSLGRSTCRKGRCQQRRGRCRQTNRPPPVENCLKDSVSRKKQQMTKMRNFSVRLLGKAHGASKIAHDQLFWCSSFTKRKCDVFVPSVAQGTASVGSPSQAEAVGLFMQWRCLDCVAHVAHGE